MDKKILCKWLKAGYIHNRTLYPTEAGFPQGSICSPTLANMTLDGLERELKSFPKQDKVHMVRYADDFIITGNSKEVLEHEVRPFVEKFLFIRFAAENKDKRYPNGKPYVITLFRASDVPIKRHIQIKGEANPFDPKFEPYFEERMTSKMRDNLKGNKRLFSLWLSQGGNCPVCQQKLTDTMQWRLHYSDRKVEGGSDKLSNLTLTHPHCHKKLHV